jgi:hypothetical protein
MSIQEAGQGSETILGTILAKWVRPILADPCNYLCDSLLAANRGTGPWGSRKWTREERMGHLRSRSLC